MARAYGEILKIAEEELEERLNHSYELGQVVGLEEAYNYILGRAGAEFTDGHDERARELRSLALRFKKKSEDKRIKVDKMRDALRADHKAST